MYRFLLQPKWLIRHVFVVLLVVVMVNLGFWQLRRQEEKAATTALMTDRADLTAEPVGELLDGGIDADAARVDELRFRPATATGTYLTDEEALVRSRSLAGRPGFWVLTPLDLGGGSVLVVNRGWIPFEIETDGSDIEFDTPTGEVVVEGLLREGVGGARVGGDDRVTINHVDLEWFDEQIGGAVYPVYLDLVVQSPAQLGELPTLLEPPELDASRSFGYAMQWFIFSTIAVIGYPIIVYRVAHSPPPTPRESELVDDPSEPTDPGDPGGPGDRSDLPVVTP